MTLTVAVPIYRWPLPTAEAWALESFAHSREFGQVVAVGPVGLAAKGLNLPFEAFPAECFASRKSYSQLLLSAAFYGRFCDSDFLLIAQTDAAWFGGDIAQFARSCDYVGAPWLRTPGVAASGFSRVGNGGLSLRRTSRFLKVLDGAAIPSGFLDILRGAAAPDLASIPPVQRFFKALRLATAARGGARAFVSGYTLNEDRFWSDRATILDRDFRVASVEEGLRFAFEEAPRLAYELNGRRLPLGAHAWQLYDPDFWLEMVPNLPRSEK